MLQLLILFGLHTRTLLFWETPVLNVRIRQEFVALNVEREKCGAGCESTARCLPLGVSTCDFHLRLWPSAQQDIPERVFARLNINSPSKQLREGWSGWGGVGGSGQARPQIPIENKPGCSFIGPRNINLLREEPRTDSQRRSAGACPRLNDTCTSPSAASADSAAARRRQAGGN